VSEHPFEKVIAIPFGFRAGSAVPKGVHSHRQMVPTFPTSSSRHMGSLGPNTHFNALGNPIGPTGVTALAAMLKSDTTTHKLNLSSVLDAFLHVECQGCLFCASFVCVCVVFTITCVALDANNYPDHIIVFCQKQLPMSSPAHGRVPSAKSNHCLLRMR